MSFSINARAATKDDLRQAVADKMDGIVAQQEVHKADSTMAQDTAMAAVDMLDDLPEPAEGQDATHEYSCTVSGSLSWPYVEGETPEKFTSVNLTVNAAILARTSSLPTCSSAPPSPSPPLRSPLHPPSLKLSALPGTWPWHSRAIAWSCSPPPLRAWPPLAAPWSARSTARRSASRSSSRFVTSHALPLPERRARSSAGNFGLREGPPE